MKNFIWIALLATAAIAVYLHFNKKETAIEKPVEKPAGVGIKVPARAEITTATKPTVNAGLLTQMITE